MATELATAYVQIVPSADGISGKLKTLLNDELESAGTSGGETWGGSFKKAVSSAVSSVATVVTDALSIAIRGIATLASEAVSAYAEYEQMVGGIEALFGEETTATATIMENAANAFKTAGMSANDYMETVTNFAASLLSGLGGDADKAAEIANIAITDMADNANKMGTDIESIQNAYQGFAKQNYTIELMSAA